MVTGRPGTGKTTLVGELVEYLSGEHVKTANLVSTQLQANDLLKMVAYSFGCNARSDDKAGILQALDFQLTKWNHEGRRAVLIVDEAQGLTESAMEELRLLTNIQLDGRPLLQIFLLGQPNLRELILRPEMEQVHQRIVAATHLKALEADETRSYVYHRLERVGWVGDPAMSNALFPLIHKFSEGVPRRINLICSRLLLHGGVEQRHQIGVQDLMAVIEELQDEGLAVGEGYSPMDFSIPDDYDTPPVEAEPQTAQGKGQVDPGGVESAEPGSLAVPAQLHVIEGAERPADDSDTEVEVSTKEKG